MEIEIVWTNRAEKGLFKTIEYLKSNWTKKEILRLEDNINQFIERIKLQPNLYPKMLGSNVCIKEWLTNITISFTK